MFNLNFDPSWYIYVFHAVSFKDQTSNERKHLFITRFYSIERQV